MTGFTFSAEQVKSAPPDVRRWIENEINRALGAPSAAPSGPTTASENALAICTADEVAELFKLISGKFFVMQVLFELGRETPNHAAQPLRSYNLGEILRRAQLADGNQLFLCFDALNQALQAIRNDPNASLFAFDDAGHVYIHETTYRSIRRLWEQVALAHSFAANGRPTDLEHIPIRSNRSDQQDYVQAFDSGAISDRPNEAIWSESALGQTAAFGRPPSHVESHESMMRPEHAFADGPKPGAI
jgi:hypothetical protein